MPDAHEDLREQRVELEVREGDIGDGLHVLEPQPGLPLRGEQLCVLDADCCAIGDELKQIDVGRVELARCERADVKNADRPARDEERHAEHRRQSLFP